jgi:hypothetical protein
MQLPLWNLYVWHGPRFWNGMTPVLRRDENSVAVFDRDFHRPTRELLIAALTQPESR